MQLDLSFQETPAPTAATPQIFTVSALTRMIRKVLESRINEIWVEGEISNLRKQASGHSYFTLKDAAAQISCVLFAQQARYGEEVRLQDGMEVQLFGELSVYELRGQYQVVVRLVQPKGFGVLQAKFEAIKRQLAAEGLFNAERKRSLPRFPQRIGVVTSPTGAAIHDFLHVLQRRHPGVEIVLYPVRVQGKGAATEIATAVRNFAQFGENGMEETKVDVIVVTRGGGSIEDLWPFNEEIVARALFDSPIPTVSAVGHEIDFTIADFVADVRAPTPSAAAEVLVVDQEDLRTLLCHQAGRLLRHIRNTLQLNREQISFFRRSALVREPRRALLETRQNLDRLEATAISSLQKRRRDLRTHLLHTLAILQSRNPTSALHQMRQALNAQTRRLEGKAPLILQQHRHQLHHLHCLLEAFSPQATLLRGFTITTQSDGSLLNSAVEAQQCLEICTRFADGEIHSQVLPPS